MNLATATLAALVAMVAVRLFAGHTHGMWLWGLNPQRFLSPPLRWATWLLMALPLMPPFASRLGAACAAFGDQLAVSRRTRLVTAALFATALFLLDDRTLWTGDALIRNAASDAPGFLERFKQSLPVELFLYERLPLALERFGIPVTLPVQLLGAASAFALWLAGVALGVTIAGRGARLVAVTSIVACGGWLVCFTGLGKPAAVLCALTAIAAVAAVRAVRTGSGLEGLGVTVAIAIGLHRAGIFLLPCWILALVLAWRHRTTQPPRRPALYWAFSLLPLLAIALQGGRIFAIATGVDLPLHLLAASPAPIEWRGLDLLNLALLLCPAGLALVALGRWRGWARSGEFAVLAALLAPWLVLAIGAQPGQGLFRDLDFFAPGGVALAACVAWALFGAREANPLGAPVSAALAAACAVPALQLLLCFHDPRAGQARVSAYLSESPRRPEAEQIHGWDFLARRALTTGDWANAVIACNASARLAPNPRMWVMLGIARTYTGDFAGAQDAYARVIERSPHELVAWAGLMGIASRLGDPALADSALARMRMHPADGLKARELALLIEQYPEFWPASAAATARRTSGSSSRALP